MNENADIYRLMIEGIEDYAILLLDKNGNVQNWNKGAEKIKGYKPGEIIGENFRLFYTKEDQDNGLPAQLLAYAIEYGKTNHEGWQVRKDRSIFWGSVHISTIYGEDNTIAGFTKITRDLTDRKHAEEKQIRFKEELECKVKERTGELNDIAIKYRLLFSNNPMPMWVFDLETFKFLDVNDQAVAHYGYSREEFLSLSVIDIRPDHQKDFFIKTDHSVGLSSQNYYRGIWKHKKKDGTIIDVEIFAHDTLFEGKNARLILSNDITEKKAAEEKIIKANRLYAVTSAINKAIVYANDEQDLYKDACRIAIEVGKFEYAWIGIADEPNQKIKLVAQHNLLKRDIELFRDYKYGDGSIISFVLGTGKYYARNDFENIPDNLVIIKHFRSRGIRSAIGLPVKKAGKTIAVFHLCSTKSNTFNDDEVNLLEEIALDISFAVDVFEKEKKHKQIEKKIAQSEQRLKQAQAVAHFGSWQLDILNATALWSEEACRIYGLDPADNVHSQHEWSSYMHPDDLDYVVKTYNDGMKMHKNLAFYHRIIRKNGNVRYLFTQAQFQYDEEGTPVELYGVAHDITETKEAESALAQSEANLRLIMDLIPQAVFAKDFNGQYLFSNKNFAALYGLTPEELVNKSVIETIPVTSQGEAFLAQDREVIRSGKTKIIPENIFTDYKGNTRIFHSVKVPFIVAGTNERAVLGIIEDITEQKSAENERAKIIAHIVQRNKDLEQFSYIVSHNLRAPVANIMGIAEVMKIKKNEKYDQDRFLHELGVAVKKLDDVIMDLNHILQVKHTENKIKELVRFSELLSDIKLSVDNLIKNNEVQILCDFSEVDEMLTFKSYLYSIFFNLISNSIKFKQPGIPPVIEIKSAMQDNKIIVIFKDNGIGIDLKKRQQQVFGLYKRFHNHVDGKGMGLYMVKTQVESLGGNITISSEVNKGTEFRIEFEISSI